MKTEPNKAPEPATTDTLNEQKKSPSAGFHIGAWLGFPLYAGLFVLAAISAAGAPGANHSALSWNSIAWLVPMLGCLVSIIAITQSRSWIGRSLGAIPLIGYLAVIGYLIAWTHNH
ncbi:MAG TPA: hypothetical protein VFB27_12515 [Opitutaceae bacterium]|nr:hypothetical protein [Opitutaceae bacterium]